MLAVGTTLNIYAKDLPIGESQTVYVPQGEFGVLDFPFKIGEISPSPFVGGQQIQSQQSFNDIDLASLNQPVPAGQEVSAKGGPIEIKKGQNILQIRSDVSGQIEFVVYGGRAPIMVKVRVAKDIGEKLYKFYEPSDMKKNAAEFESSQHEVVCEDITKALWLDKTPDGYKAISEKNEGKNGVLSFELIRKIVGSGYQGETWIVTNTDSSRTINLHEEMFVKNAELTYAITLEANRLAPNEKARVFIVRGIK